MVPRRPAGRGARSRGDADLVHPPAFGGSQGGPLVGTAAVTVTATATATARPNADAADAADSLRRHQQVASRPIRFLFFLRTAPGRFVIPSKREESAVRFERPGARPGLPKIPRLTARNDKPFRGRRTRNDRCVGCGPSARRALGASPRHPRNPRLVLAVAVAFPAAIPAQGRPASHYPTDGPRISRHSDNSMDPRCELTRLRIDQVAEADRGARSDIREMLSPP